MGFTESTVSRDDPSWCALPGSPTPPASVPHVPGAAAWGLRNGQGGMRLYEVKIGTAEVRGGES